MDPNNLQFDDFIRLRKKQDIGLPYEVLNFNLKFEGLIGLGPKWDYVYKLTPISRDLLNTKHILAFNDAKSHINDQEEKNGDEISSTDDLITDSDESKYTARIVNEKLNDYLNLKQNEFITKESNVEHESYIELKDDSKKFRDKTHHKITKQYFDLRNTYALVDHFNRNENEDSKLDIGNKMDNNFKAQNKKLSIDDGIKINKHIKHVKANNKQVLNEFKIKDNAKIMNFILHIFEQSLNIFDEMEKLIDVEKVKEKIRILKDGYVEKFGDYLKETEGHKLKTKLAKQNVILNTIDMSNVILKRLSNHLSKDTNGYNKEINSDIAKIFKSKIARENYLENKHACNKLAVCRTNNEYSDFINDILYIILQTSNFKIKQAADALTEVVKTKDLTNIIDNENQKKLRKLMSNIETWDPFLIRSMFLTLRLVIGHKNQPIKVMDAADVDLANKTASFYNIIDILNKNMGSVDNKLQWNDIKRQMEDWRDGKRSDVQNILESLIQQMINELEKLEYEHRKTVNDVMKILLKSR